MPHHHERMLSRVTAPIGRFELIAMAQNVSVDTTNNDSDPVLAMSLGHTPYMDRGQLGQASFELGSINTGFRRLGSMVLRPGAVEMHARAATGPSNRLLMITFDRAQFEAVTELRRWSAEMLDVCHNLASPRLSKLLRNVVRELETPRLKGEIALSALGNLALVEVARTFSDGVGRPSGLPRWQLDKIERKLKDADGHWPNGEELAQLCGISAGHLSRSFRATTGQTISEYAAEIRMTRAREFLASDDLTLQQIAGRLGFNSPSSFSYSFRQAMGQTPKAYRQLTRGAQAA